MRINVFLTRWNDIIDKFVKTKQRKSFSKKKKKIIVVSKSYFFLVQKKKIMMNDEHGEVMRDNKNTVSLMYNWKWENWLRYKVHLWMLFSIRWVCETLRDLHYSMWKTTREKKAWDSCRMVEFQRQTTRSIHRWNDLNSNWSRRWSILVPSSTRWFSLLIVIAIAYRSIAFVFTSTFTWCPFVG